MKKFSLKAKLIAAFMAVASLLAIVAGVNLYYTKSVDREYSDVTDRILPNIGFITTMRVSGLRISRLLPQAGMALADGRASENAEAEYKSSRADYEKARAAYLKTEWYPGEEAVFKELDQAFSAILPSAEKLLNLSKASDRANYGAFVKGYEGEYLPAYAKVQTAFDKLTTFEDKIADENSQQAKDVGHTAVLVSSGLVVVGVLLAMAMGWFQSAKLGNDLARIVARVETAAKEVASAAAQISTSSSELSESSTEQAAAIQETAASVDEVSAMIKKNSENAGRSQGASAESKAQAEGGERQVITMTESISAIAGANERIMRQVDEGNREISEIVKVINEIGSKTKVINDIVFQTKLLSFNASVEAARAGEHGKGFAVVAEEVGNLAQMSGNAAKEITDMLEASVKKVEGIVTRTKEGVGSLILDAKAKVEGGTRTAQECGYALSGILKSVASVDQMVGEISYASREQATGMSEITKAMAQLDQATNQNSAVSQQCAAASEQLSGQAQGMAQLVTELNLLLKGGAAEGAPSENSRPANSNSNGPGAKVLKLPAKKPMRASVGFKAAAGSDLPAADDPRFEDV